jgi:hypothetical protein
LGVYAEGNPGIGAFSGASVIGMSRIGRYYTIAATGTELGDMTDRLYFRDYKNEWHYVSFDDAAIEWDDEYNKDKPGIQTISGTYRGCAFTVAVFLTTGAGGDSAGRLPTSVDSVYPGYIEGIFFIAADGNGDYELPEYYVEYDGHKGAAQTLPLSVENPRVFGLGEDGEAQAQYVKMVSGQPADSVYPVVVTLTADTYSFKVTGFAIFVTYEVFDTMPGSRNAAQIFGLLSRMFGEGNELPDALFYTDGETEWAAGYGISSEYFEAKDGFSVDEYGYDYIDGSDSGDIAWALFCNADYGAYIFAVAVTSGSLTAVEWDAFLKETLGADYAETFAGGDFEPETLDGCNMLVRVYTGSR